MTPRDPIYVVLGATRRVGRCVVERLLERGLRVRAVNCHGEVPTLWRAAGVETFSAQAVDAAALTEAFTDVAGVVFVSEPAYSDADPVGRAAAAGAAAAEALRAARVPCAVMLSTIGAQLSMHSGVALFGHRFEQALAGTTQTLVRVRAAWWLEEWLHGAQLARDKGLLPSLLQRLDARVPWVSIGDIGRVLVAELLGAIGQVTIELSGPVDLSPADVAQAYARALDQPVRPMIISRSERTQMLEAWGNSPRSIELWDETFEVMDAGALVFESPRNARIRTMRGHQTVADVIATADALRETT